MYDKIIEYIYLKQNITPYVYWWMGMCFNEIDIYKMHNVGEGISSYNC